MSQVSSQDNQDETSGERPGSPPNSHDEILAQIQALIDEAIAILERRADRHG
jgi:hypothetical protein